jgi:hypothetical protein
MTGPARVRWRPGASGGNLLGYVGTLPSWSFQIFSSGDPAEGRKMIAQLPGMSGVIARDRDADLLKDVAEGWLVGFVASVGAVFRDTTPTAQASDPYEVDDMDEPEPAPWDPGDEADDQGGMSEHRYLITEDDRERG